MLMEGGDGKWNHTARLEKPGTVRLQSEDDSDRIDEESREVGDGLPLALDARRVGVDDDVAQPVSEQRAGSQRAHEVDESELVRVAAGVTQHQDHVLREHVVTHRLTVLYVHNGRRQFHMPL